MGLYAVDVVTYDIAPPLRQRKAEIRSGLKAWFESFRGPIGYEIRDLSLAVGDEVAFGHGLVRLRGARTNGEEADLWLRATEGLRSVDGRWLVAHEHSSVPMHMDGSGKAAVDLKP